MKKEDAIKYLQQLYPNGGHCWLDEQRIEAIGMAVKALQEEPVSEDLETAIEWYMTNVYCGDTFIEDVARYFANWQRGQFEKNRIAACDKQTEEEAEIERDFVMSIIEKEHRQPTFDDAIKYGIRLKEKEMQSTIELAEDHAMLAGMEKMKQQMMEKAIDGKVIANGMGNPILHLWDKGRHLIGKKVKVIVIEEG